MNLLPTEIIYKIFSYIPIVEIYFSLYYVNKKFYLISERYININIKPIKPNKKYQFVHPCYPYEVFGYFNNNEEFYRYPKLNNGSFYNLDLQDYLISLINSHEEITNLEFIKKHNIKVNIHQARYMAAYHGKLNLLMYLYKKGETLTLTDYIVCIWAAFNGHLDCLKYTYVYGGGCEQICSFAALNGHLDCLRYAHENGCKWEMDTCSYAAKNGHLDCLRYAHENGCKWDIHTSMNAAKNGHLDCLKYAHENECPWDEICDFASKNGHLDCLKYAHENGCEWDSYTCRCAAINGHLDCLKYAHENGCEWDESTCKNAAKNGHLDCLKYAHENGCKWNESTCKYAAKNGHLDCLKYAHENGCPWDHWVYMAITFNHLDCLKYAYENGCEFPKNRRIYANRDSDSWKYFCKVIQS